MVFRRPNIGGEPRAVAVAKWERCRQARVEYWRVVDCDGIALDARTHGDLGDDDGVLVEYGPTRAVAFGTSVDPPLRFCGCVTTRQYDGFTIAGDGIRTEGDAGIGGRAHCYFIGENAAIQGQFDAVGAGAVHPLRWHVDAVVPGVVIGSGRSLQRQAVVQAQIQGIGQAAVKEGNVGDFHRIPFDACPDADFSDD